MANTKSGANTQYDRAVKQHKIMPSSCLRGDGELATAILDGLLDGIVLVDTHGEVAYVNRAFEEMLGYKAEELIGRYALSLPTYQGSKQGSNKAAAIFQQVIEKGYAEPVDMVALTKGGEKIPLNFTASVIRAGDGSPRTFVAVIRDIAERKKLEEALRQSEQVARAMLDTAGTGIYLLQNGRFQYVNRLFEAISGYSNSELEGQYSLGYIYPDDRDFVRKQAIDILKGKSSFPYEYRMVRKDREIVWVLDRLASIQYDGERSVLGSMMDISEIKKAEAQILEHSKQLETLFDIGITASRTLEIEELLNSVLDKVLGAMDLDAGGIFLLDQQNNELVLKAHRGASQKFVRQVERLRLSKGFNARLALSGKPLIVPDVKSDTRLLDMGIKNEGIQSLAAIPVMSKEQILGVMVVSSHSPQKFAQSSIRLLTTIANQIGMAIDNARLYERALQLAFTDTLTGLYNRRYLLEELDREFARANRNESPLSLVMMDLDGLKAINDRFGHNEGDVVLNRLGRILKRNTRASDVAARWGGDEFVLLAPDTDSKRAVVIGERIRSEVERCRPIIAKQHITISVSVGIASYPAHASRVTELVKRADHAMYNAKGLGKNQVCVFWNGKTEQVYVRRRNGNKSASACE